MTFHAGHFLSDGGQNPSTVLKLAERPKFERSGCRVARVAHVSAETGAFVLRSNRAMKLSLIDGMACLNTIGECSTPELFGGTAEGAEY